MESLTLSLVIKLGSIARHVEEFVSDHGADVDINAAAALLNDHEVQSWMESADKMGLLPVMRR